MGVSTSPGRIIAETSKETSLRTDRLSQFRHRMSLFLQTLVLRGILFRKQEHRQENMNLGAGGGETCIRCYEQHESFKLT